MKPECTPRSLQSQFATVDAKSRACASFFNLKLAHNQDNDEPVGLQLRKYRSQSLGLNEIPANRVTQTTEFTRQYD
jgi:hypothetical protein